MNYLRLLGVPCSFFLFGIVLSMAEIKYNNYMFYVILFVGLVIYYVGKNDGRDDVICVDCESGGKK